MTATNRHSPKREKRVTLYRCVDLVSHPSRSLSSPQPLDSAFSRSDDDASYHRRIKYTVFVWPSFLLVFCLSILPSIFRFSSHRTKTPPPRLCIISRPPSLWRITTPFLASFGSFFVLGRSQGWFGSSGSRCYSFVIRRCRMWSYVPFICNSWVFVVSQHWSDRKESR